MKLRTIIWGIQSVLILIFLVFSFIPLFSVVSLLFIQIYSSNLIIIVSSIGITLLLGSLGIYGIITLKLEFRGISTAILISGILLSRFLLALRMDPMIEQIEVFDDPFILALWVILTWGFYEVWFLTSRYKQLDQEYDSYPAECIERKKLAGIFRLQFISFGLLVWIAISICFLVLYLASNFFIEVGKVYGTLGISISAAMLILLYLIRKYTGSSSTLGKIESQLKIESDQK